MQQPEKIGCFGLRDAVSRRSSATLHRARRRPAGRFTDAAEARSRRRAWRYLIACSWCHGRRRLHRLLSAATPRPTVRHGAQHRSRPASRRATRAIRKTCARHSVGSQAGASAASTLPGWQVRLRLRAWRRSSTAATSGTTARASGCRACSAAHGQAGGRSSARCCRTWTLVLAQIRPPGSRRTRYVELVEGTRLGGARVRRHRNGSACLTRRRQIKMGNSALAVGSAHRPRASSGQTSMAGLLCSTRWPAAPEGVGGAYALMILDFRKAATDSHRCSSIGSRLSTLLSGMQWNLGFCRHGLPRARPAFRPRHQSLYDYKAAYFHVTFQLLRRSFRMCVGWKRPNITFDDRCSVATTLAAGVHRGNSP